MALLRLTSDAEDDLPIVNSLELDRKDQVEFKLEASDESEVSSSSSEDSLSKLTLSFSGERANLSWRHLNVAVQSQQSWVSKMKCWQSAVQPPKQILFDVTGAVQSGQLVALMGASGAGKTTLLNVLNSRNTVGFNVSGEVLVNGEGLGRDINSISAYVQQEDLFVGVLTVMAELGLIGCANTPIGIPGQIAGISGGEKKRLAFASETLTNPAIFFCDEPTTGLDSYMAEQVVGVLQKMASAGKTILCIIHQPASEVYTMFDRVLILAEGRTAFFGPTQEALPFFHSFGYVCPKAFNPADFFIQTLAVVPSKAAESRQKIQSICNTFDKSELDKQVAEMVDRNEKDETSFKFSSLGQSSSYRVGWCAQFSALLWRSTLYNYRNRRIVMARMVQKVIIGLFVGLLYFHTRLSQTNIMNIKGALFYLVIQLAMPAVMGTLRFLPSEFPILVREYHDGTYKVSSYYWSKVVSFVPVFSLDGVLFISIAYFMIGLRPTAFAFLLSLCVTILIEQCSSAFGTMLSACASSFAVALTLAGPILTIVRMTSGLLTNVGTLPPYISWIQYLSWWRYGYEAMSILQWHNVNITCESHLASCIPSGDAVLSSLSFSAYNLGQDIGLIAVLMIGFYCMGYVALFARAYRAR